MTCTVDGCAEPVRCKGMCARHYFTENKRRQRRADHDITQQVTCGDCGVLIAVVRSDEAVRAAIDNHRCQRRSA